MSSIPPANEDLNRIELPAVLFQQMLAHILRCLPEEACGVLGGQLDGSTAVAQSVISVENELHSPVRFRMVPEEQLKAFLWLEEHSQELIAVFHSHPKGPDHPSATDLAEFAYPGILTLIISRQNPQNAPAVVFNGYQVRAYRVDGVLSAQSSVSEVPLLVIDMSR